MGANCCNNGELIKKNADLALDQKKALCLALIVNSLVFVCEVTGGTLAQSEAILADSIHLLSHLFVILLTLIVLKKSVIWKTRAAFLKALLIAGLGVSIVTESFNSLFLSSHLPEARVMSATALIAFVGNLLTLWVLKKHLPAFRKPKTV